MPDTSLTGVVPAAPCCAASPPGAVELDGVPVTHVVSAQSVWREVADLQPRELPQELVKGHPGKIQRLK